MDDRPERDADLVQASLAGDDEAFGLLVRRYQRLVASVGWRYGARADEIEDLTSEVFFKVFRNLHRYRPEHPFSTWLYRLAANHVVDNGRRRKRRERGRSEMPDQVVDPSPGPAALGEAGERVERLRAALTRLRPPFREAIFLVHLEGLSVEEAARALGVPSGTVKSRLKRGRDRLKELLARGAPELFHA